MEAQSRKVENFVPTILYGKRQMTLFHSLEAFVGTIEFDKVKHHCTDDTGIFGSPAATAAYLIHSTTGDPRAETYLRRTVAARRDKGGVPSAFPTCVFELSWAVSTLLSHCVQLTELIPQPTANISQFLMETLHRQNELVGFAPGVLEDADDTARILVALRSLGHPVDPKPMVDKFEAKRHFKTYDSEQNASFSANCNVLLALLDPQYAEQYIPQIGKILLFLLERWDEGRLNDKWNITSQYSLMLFGEALTRLLDTLETGEMCWLPEAISQRRVIHVLAQVLSRTLSEQQSDGSWQASVETTSYSVLTLARCLSLPWSPALRATLAKSLCQGRSFIESKRTDASQTEHLWIGKTTYGCHLLSKVYETAALHASYSQRSWSSQTMKVCRIEDERPTGMQRLLSDLPFFQQHRLLSLELVLVEAAHYVDLLGRAESAIFASDVMRIKEGKYQDFIPLIWVACNHLAGHGLHPNQLWSMITLSLFIYQTDEYMESVVTDIGEPKLSMLVAKVAYDCGLQDQPLSGGEACKERLDGQQTSINGLEVPCDQKNPSTALSKLVRHILHYPAVLRAPQWSQKELAVEVDNLILAHIRHSHDSRVLLGASPKETGNHGILQKTQHNYFKWVRSVASDDTSCPMAFRYLTCLMGQPGQDLLDGPHAHYISQSLISHLSAMCRQYNDYGSATRDAEEGNLNSLQFPEFDRHSSTSWRINGSISHDENHGTNGIVDCNPCSGQVSNEAKKELMNIAEYERADMELAVQHLRKVVKAPSALRALEVYIDVTDLFGQIYVAQDLSSWRKEV
ncbi:MAG: hypothetical protein Q9183_001785 [Haloplaca sp. 2 TL-2023]